MAGVLNKGDKKRIKQIVSNDRSIDVTLFGRMVADDTDLNVDACAQVAHAISVQTVEPESDFFTAVDDNQRNGGEDEAGDVGAAMMGQVEFNAATFYTTNYSSAGDRVRQTVLCMRGYRTPG